LNDRPLGWPGDANDPPPRSGGIPEAAAFRALEGSKYAEKVAKSRRRMENGDNKLTADRSQKSLLNASPARRAGPPPSTLGQTLERKSLTPPLTTLPLPQRRPKQ
jgi:hypothetical protein